MKKKLLSLLLLLPLTLSLFVGCGGDNTSESSGGGDNTETIDYASMVSLDMTTAETQKMEVVSVVHYIDGDTTHFQVPANYPVHINDQGVLKARYLSVNTPESTGTLEEWGKAAARYTKTALSSASSIVLETDGTQWETDSTGERHLVWVWYKPQGADEYRNLNIELLQNGLAVGSKSAETRYGDICIQAINYATQKKLHVHSGEKDPEFFYGAALEMDIRKLRLNIEEYAGDKDQGIPAKRVAFEGVVVQNDGNGVYVEAYDDETQSYYGVYVYYGYSLTGAGARVLTVGNKVRVVGDVGYFESGNSYQVSNLKYNSYDKTNPDNIQKLGDGEKGAYPIVTAAEFNGKKTISFIEEAADGTSTTKTITEDFGKLALNTSITMENLYVEDVYTTNNGGANDGAMTLTCKVGNETITVRTTKLYKDILSQTLYTEADFLGKTITVKGVVDYYDSGYSNDSPYQIMLFDYNDVKFL